MWGIGEVMAMTATALLNRALKIVGDSTLTTEAQEWFENILYEVMAVGKWRHLQKNTTQVTANDDDEYDLPSDYNNFLVVTSTASPYELVRISKDEIEVLRRKGDTGNPKLYAIYDTSYAVYPKPVTDALPTLTLSYQKTMSIPSASNEVETVTGLSSYWIKYLIDGVVAEGFRYIDDARQDSARIKWENGLMLMQRYCGQALPRGGSRVSRSSNLRGSGLPRGR